MTPILIDNNLQNDKYFVNKFIGYSTIKILNSSRIQGKN